MSVAASERSLAEVRRAQVLDASVLCFGRSGFHGASMADIAAEAAMSVGQIYRYFANKEAIIAAIVARDLAEAAKLMEAVRARQGEPVEELIEVVRYKMAHLDDPVRAALSLEILAEAARNPRVAAIVREADQTGRGWLRELMTRRGGDEASLEARMDMIALLVEGWTVRLVKNPDVDRQAYLASLRDMLQHLFAEAASPGCG
jgi:TetR/AcrR family transcriptional regulator, repressor for uid operon